MNPFFNIRLRLAASFCLLAIALIVVGWQGMSHLHQLNSQVQNALANQCKVEQLSHEAFRLSNRNSRINLLVFLLDDQDEIKRLLAERAANSDRVSDLLSVIEPRLGSKKEKELLADLKSKRTPYVESYKQALALLLTEQKPDEARKMLLEVVRPNLSAYHDAWDAFSQNEADEIDRVTQQSKANYVAGQREFLLTLVMAGLITGGIAIFTVMRMGREMAVRQRAEQSLQEAHGQLELRIQERTAELKKTNEALQAEITERKQAEEQIAEQAALLDKARDAILVRDLEGKILFWSKGAERIYGWMSQEAVGRNVLEILGTDPKKFVALNGLTISQGEWDGEIQHLTKERREITVDIHTTLIQDDKGHPKSVLSINTDITEKKNLEAQFLRAQRMESIGTLAGGVAHDLNNILAPIMMSIDILKTTSDSPETQRILETIGISAKRGADIVRQVLTFARGIEGERIEVQPKHLLKELENIIKDTFPKNILLQFRIPNDTWTIQGDPTQVHQILLNLSVNARDAMPNGGTLTIGVENCVIDEQYAAMNLQAKPGRYVKISVTDSGTGIPQDIIDKIFDPFFTTKELSKGTGLGLSTVMGIVKSHEGFINVYSEPGKGTTFRVYLPVIELSSEARKEQTQRLSPPRGNGETILVVDDEASILTITSQTLQTFGYRTLTATDGATAVAVYAEHMNEIAVVLTDMAMPIMDGPATIRALKQINPAVKIIAASGLNANGGVAKVSGAGVKHFLTKPYTAATLLRTMRAILDEA